MVGIDNVNHKSFFKAKKTQKIKKKKSKKKQFHQKMGGGKIKILCVILMTLVLCLSKTSVRNEEGEIDTEMIRTMFFQEGINFTSKTSDWMVFLCEKNNTTCADIRAEWDIFCANAKNLSLECKEVEIVKHPNIIAELEIAWVPAILYFKGNAIYFFVGEKTSKGMENYILKEEYKKYRYDKIEAKYGR